MKRINYPTRNEWPSLLQRPVFDAANLSEVVGEVLRNVRSRGDEAVREYTLKFDKSTVEDFNVSESEISGSEAFMTSELKQAINLSAANITAFHAAQDTPLPTVETMPGVTCWQKAMPIEKVGLYIPGGTAPLFSTVLMLALPAKIAGCREIIVCTPPNSEGKVHPAILYAAKVAGVTKVFRIGGVQAIAAMAYGTSSVPKVYKIFGPGNQYVTAAKQIVSLHDVAIDMPAGPSEVEVLADETAVPAFVASDLLSQAEHGKDSQSILITTSTDLADAVEMEVFKQLELLPRKDLAALSIQNSKIIVVRDMDDAIEATNEYAPEHLIIATKNHRQISDRIINAGSIFLGNLTPESAGDYASGTNHTLPTNGFSKMYSGVNLDSFRKKITYQEITAEGLRNIGPAIEIMAETESLIAHKNAVTLRMNEL